MAATKTKVVRLRFSVYALFICIFSFALFVFSSLIIRQHNVTLSKKLQNLNAEISTYQTANAAIELDIQQLSAYDRVMAIATEDSMAMYEDNIVTIVENN